MSSPSRPPARRPLLAALAVGAVVTCAFGGAARAEHADRGIAPLAENDPTSAEGLPKGLENVGIDPRLGAEMPKELTFRTQDGAEVKLGSYFDGKRPVIVALAYYSCPMLCTLVLNGLADGMKELGFAAGTDYRVVTVSIDPRDTVEIAKAKRANYAGYYGRPVPDGAWDFLTSDAATSKALADALGFKYRWDEEAQQFAHAAGIFVLTPDGRLSRTLFGVHFESNDLRLALTEASNGTIASLVDKVLLFCFHYEPKAGKYVVAAKRLMSAGGVFTMLALGLFLAVQVRRERRAAVQVSVHES
jgi:protein SCO1/2